MDAQISRRKVKKLQKARVRCRPKSIGGTPRHNYHGNQRLSDSRCYPSGNRVLNCLRCRCVAAKNKRRIRARSKSKSRRLPGGINQQDGSAHAPRKRSAGKRVITATEMLESMIYKPRPTRAETSDVANAVYDGTGAVMLSGETAAGSYPVQAVKAMSDISAYTEQSIHYRKRFAIAEYETNSIADAVCASAVKASYDLDCNAIVIATRSGKTAKLISGFRPSAPIIAVTRHESTYHKMALTWGVQPILAADQPEATHEAALQATKIAKYFDLVKKGDIVVAVASTGIEDANTLTIERV